MRDPHRDVIAHHSEVVDRSAVAPEDHEVVEVPPLEADTAVHRVVPGDLIVLEQEADGERRTRPEPLLDLGGRESAAAPVVAERAAGRLSAGALGVQLLPGAEAAVGLSLRQQALGIGPVAGAVLALEERPLVPGDPQPAEPVEDDAGVALGAALAVGVLDTKHECAAGVPGVEPVEQRGARAADVQVSRGGGSEADARRGHEP